MVLAVDTDVLLSWMMSGSPHHKSARELFNKEIREGGKLGFTPQVIFEFLHISTDPKRFQRPLKMEQATSISADLWDAGDVVQITPEPTMVYETLDLLGQLKLGRKRILDTALAVTLKQAGVKRLATLNRQDFEIFPFLELVLP